jgi:hypothetical protein
VVVGGNQLTPGGAEKDGVSGIRAADIDRFRSAVGDGWNHLTILFISEKPALSGVWIDAGKCDPWPLDTIRFQLAIDQPDQPPERRTLYETGDVTQGNVCRQQCNAETRSDEGHRIVFTRGQMGKKLSMAWKRNTGHGQRLLVDRRGRHRGNLASKAERNCRLDRSSGERSSQLLFSTHGDAIYELLTIRAAIVFTSPQGSHASVMWRKEERTCR